MVQFKLKTFDNSYNEIHLDRCVDDSIYQRLLNIDGTANVEKVNKYLIIYSIGEVFDSELVKIKVRQTLLAYYASDGIKEIFSD